MLLLNDRRPLVINFPAPHTRSHPVGMHMGKFDGSRPLFSQCKRSITEMTSSELSLSSTTRLSSPILRKIWRRKGSTNPPLNASAPFQYADAVWLTFAPARSSACKADSPRAIRMRRSSSAAAGLRQKITPPASVPSTFGKDHKANSPPAANGLLPGTRSVSTQSSMMRTPPEKS